MSKKIKNPLAQALGLVLQGMRDKMGGVSSSEVASMLGLAASHYRMIEAGSAILQPSRAIRIVQTFETIEFVPLCQILVAIQTLDAAKRSVADMRTTTSMLIEANPSLANVLKKFDNLWDVIKNGDPSDVAEKISAEGILQELTDFLTTEPVILTAEQFESFMTPTYRHPISGQLYDKIGNILQGVAPFYLDTVLQLIDNLRNITPRVTAMELANWESLHKNRISQIIGIVRNPEVILDVKTFDYTFLWQQSFQKMIIIHRDSAEDSNESVHQKISHQLRRKFETERIKYERELEIFDETVEEKLKIIYGGDRADNIEQILSHG
ncbi:MAG: helix-turn-helix domain-containing protein, partial [Planctomycetota bacterium]